MVFSSLEFIFRFLPLFLLIYYIMPARFRNAVLFLGSLCFYAWGDIKYLFLILISVLINYLISIEMKRNKIYSRIWLIAALLFNFGILFFFKYINFVIENINIPVRVFTHGTGIAAFQLGLPLGISFYTFQAVSYVIDVYRGDIKINPNLFRFATYLVMFPKLVSGPIASYGDMGEQLAERRYGLFKFEKGLKLFVIGLGMKVLLANRIGILWNDIQTIEFERISTPWPGLVPLATACSFILTFRVIPSWQLV